ncbi:hypothetical protein CO230_10620 [Chryseobacterium sp. 6424]|nr:hypothetical protein CO230_10620 [Chryseobacterium sp. 6424]
MAEFQRSCDLPFYKKIIVMLMFHLAGFTCAQQMLYGRIADEDQNPLSAVLIINMKSGVRIASDDQGLFEIQGNKGDEIRFVREHFDRKSVFFDAAAQKYISLELSRSAVAIEEVKIDPVKLSGNLAKDSKNLSKVDKTEQLRREVGVPAPPEKPREKAADLKKDVLKPLLALRISPQAVYDVISGDARRMKAEYRYFNLQEDIAWIRAHVHDYYFSDLGIPAEDIIPFLQSSLHESPAAAEAVKQRNLAKLLFNIEQNADNFLQRKKLNGTR